MENGRDLETDKNVQPLTGEHKVQLRKQAKIFVS